MLKRIRRSAFLDAGSPDWTDYNILEEVNDVQTQLYERAVVNAHQGHWLQTAYYRLAAGQRSYRLPERACAGGIERVQITPLGSTDWMPLPQVTEADALRYEYEQSDVPLRCAVRGESLWPLPAGTSSGYVLRVQYMIRPSRISNGSGNAGRIDAINGRVITVGAQVSSISETGSSNNPSGTQVIDIVHQEGWYGVQWTGTANISTFTITLASDPSGLAEADDLSMIKVGDRVHLANESWFPALPVDFHRSLADATAAKILTMRGMPQRSAALSAQFVTPDLQRFGDMLQPRVTADAPKFVAPEFG